MTTMTMTTTTKMEVDRQCTLNDVLVDTWLVTNLKLAKGDAWKALRVWPVLTADEAVDDVDAVQVEIGTEESVEEENLSHGVRQVERFDGQVCGNQVVTVEAAADDAADLGDEVFDANHAAGFVLSLRQKVAVHLVDDVANCFLSDFEVGRPAADTGRVHDRRQVDPGAFVEEAPEQRRRGGQNCLKEKYERDPLVVADERRATLGVRLPHHNPRIAADHVGPRTAGGDHSEPVGGNGLFDRQVVGVADPADRVGVVAVTVGELGRAPARDRAADELLGADEEREADEHDDGVLTTESVDVVVIGRQLYLANAYQRLEQLLHVRASVRPVHAIARNPTI